MVTLASGAAATAVGTQYYPLQFYTKQVDGSYRLDLKRARQNGKDKASSVVLAATVANGDTWNLASYWASYHAETGSPP